MDKPLKVVVVVGATASGKSSLAVKLAHEFNGVVISADSRQIYKGLDVATTKITPEEQEGIPHYMIDIVEPYEEFSVADYQKRVYALLELLKDEGKLPIFAGGTGLYLQAVLEGLDLATHKPNPEERQKLENTPLTELVAALTELDPVTKVDLKNKVRVIRAIEIARSGYVPTKNPPNILSLKLAWDFSREELDHRIRSRIEMLDLPNLVREAKQHTQGLSPQSRTTIGYDLVREYIEKKIDKETLFDKLAQLHRQYSKRQMTWFKRDHEIHWIKTLDEAKDLVASFLEN